MGAGLVVLISLILGVRLVREGPLPQSAVPPPPDARAPGASGPAPDISGLTPRQQFERLYSRAMEAAARGDSAALLRLTDHALVAYARLDSVDADARYHAAVLYAHAGGYDRALALADTILLAHPGHLLTFLIRGTVAELRGDEAALRRAQQEFLAAWAEAERRPRVEYLDHRQVLDEFHRAASAARGSRR
jgi:hypothetical protein